MTYSITRLDASTFAVTQSGVVVFTGSMEAVMAEHKRLMLASKPAAKASDKMAKREERRQAGMKV